MADFRSIAKLFEEIFPAAKKAVEEVATRDANGVVTVTTVKAPTVTTPDVGPLAGQARTLSESLGDAVALGKAHAEDAVEAFKVEKGSALAAGGRAIVSAFLGAVELVIPRLKRMPEYKALKADVNTAKSVEAAWDKISTFVNTPGLLKAEEQQICNRTRGLLDHHIAKGEQVATHAPLEHQARSAALQAKEMVGLERAAAKGGVRYFDKIQRAVGHIIENLHKLSASVISRDPKTSVNAMEDALVVLGKVADGKPLTREALLETVTKRAKQKGLKLEITKADIDLAFSVDGQKQLDPTKLTFIQGTVENSLREGIHQVMHVQTKLMDCLIKAVTGKASHEEAVFAQDALQAIDHVGEHFPYKSKKLFGFGDPGIKLGGASEAHEGLLGHAADTGQKAVKAPQTNVERVLAEREGRAVSPEADVAPAAGHAAKVQSKSSLNGGHVAALAAAGGVGVLAGAAISNNR